MKSDRQDGKQALSKVTPEALSTFVLDQLDEGVHVVDTTGRTVIYNRKMAEMEAMHPIDVLHKDVLDVFTFPDEGYSTLLHALRTRQPTTNIKQTYFNLRGESITTVNRTLPVIVNDKLLGAVEIARDITQIERIHASILGRSETRYTFDSIVGQGDPIQEVIELAKRAARTNSPILIAGETGTGKEMFAQSIHHASPRWTGPFISQNCAALPETLIEGILFGTARGAFPGAIDRPGLLEQADGGTLLLDELNCLSMPLQAKLLRAIQENSVRRLGDSEDRLIDVRIIATMTEDPLDAIAHNLLRKDLYYRLSVVTLFLPPLRERIEDIPELTEHFIKRYNDLFGMQVEKVSTEVMEYFLAYGWPGNVRELEHIIEGAMNLAVDTTFIDVIHLPLHLRRKLHTQLETDNSAGSQPLYTDSIHDRTLQRQLADYEQAYVLKMLSKHDGNVSATARELGVSRQSLQYRLRKWRIGESLNPV